MTEAAPSLAAMIGAPCFDRHSFRATRSASARGHALTSSKCIRVGDAGVVAAPADDAFVGLELGVDAGDLGGGVRLRGGDAAGWRVALRSIAVPEAWLE
jgi:hypothetical protein